MMLCVDKLTAGYGHGNVLHGLDLRVERGEVLGVLGRNGVGKSTLVMALMGIVAARGGSIKLDGHELAGRRVDEFARAGMAIIPQGRRIWPGLTVAEHLDLVRLRRRVGDGNVWSRDSLYQMLPRLAERRSQPAGLLSGGEQQMLAIARALLTNPSLVLMDEPSEGLAPAVVRQVGDAITEMTRAGAGVLLVEQDLQLAFSTAHRIMVLQKGEVVHACDTLSFRNQPALAHRLLGV